MPRHDHEIPDWTKCTQRVLSGAFGLDPRTIRYWKNCPRNADKTYSFPDVIGWWRAQYEEEMGVEENPKESRALELLREENYRRVKNENDAREGLLLDASDMTRELAEITNVMRQGFEGIEKTHGKRVGRALRRVIDKAEKAWGKMVEGRRA